MKVAIVHDELMRRGGAEQVVLTMLKAFPSADIYTLAYDSEGTYPDFKKHKIITSKFQLLARNVSVMHSLFYPLGIWAMKLLKVTGYDVVIISNTHCAKYVNIDSKALVFMYTHTPFRLAWNPNSYTQYLNSKGLYRKLFELVVSDLKKIDAKAAKRGDYFIGNTAEVADRIKKAYNVNDVYVINPDVKVRNFYISHKPKDYFLVVSRLEYYKKVDLAIQAFKELQLPLVVVGNGTKSTELKYMASKNIRFVSNISSDELADYYANCKALIFPQLEDYGITPLEANASGRPVIAYGKGGVLETMIPYDGLTPNCTAVFFNEQTVESLIEAVKLSETIDFIPDFIRNNALRFDENVFVKKLTAFVDEKYQYHKSGFNQEVVV